MQDKKKRNLEDDYKFSCPECKGQIVTDHDGGERFCESCGLVIDHDMILMNQPEYRAYDEEQNQSRSRLGPASSDSMHDKGLTTTIGPSMRDSHGSVLSQTARRDASRLRKWQYKMRISNSQERNLAYALIEISQKASQMELSQDVKDEAIHLYRRAVTENIIRGRSIQAVMAASFYLAARICGYPMTLDEISDSTDVSRKECGRIARFMKRRFELKVDPPTCHSFLDRFAQSMHLPLATVARAKELMAFCEEQGLYSGKAPMGIVAAVIYIAVDETAKNHTTQSEVAIKCTITEVTLRNRCKDIKEALAKTKTG